MARLSARPRSPRGSGPGHEAHLLLLQLTGGGMQNVDLWQELYALTKIHEVRFHKVAGHADNPFNNRCDELARGAIEELRSSLIANDL